jgi:hypothetical protein
VAVVVAYVVSARLTPADTPDDSRGRNLVSGGRGSDDPGARTERSG